MTNRAFVVEKIDDKFITSVKEIEVPEISDNEILIKVTYSSLNYKDALSSIGNPGVTRKFPHVTGIDAVGIIEKSNSDKFKEGEYVVVTGYDLGMNTPGGHQNYLKVPASWAIKLPDNISDFEIMALGTAGLTAALSINELQLNGITPDKGSIVVTGATGGVGSIAVSILSKIGYNVIAVTGKEEQVEYLKNLGAGEILLRNQIDAENKRPLGKALYAGVVDTVGGYILSELLKSLQYDGVATCCGLTAGINFTSSVFPFILRGVRLIGIDSVECSLKKKENIWKKLANEWKLDDLEKNSKIITLEEIQENYQAILKGKMVGRVVVKLD